MIDINNFGPFEYAVWGSVSDWIMIVVTGLTAYFLWRTLESQKEVQQAQNLLTKIEHARYRREIEPRFELLKPEIEIYAEGEQLQAPLVIFAFKLNNNQALDVKIEVKLVGKNSQKRWRFDELTKYYDKVLALDEVMIDGDYNDDQYKGTVRLIVNFQLTFTDIEGVKFRQWFRYRRNNENETVESGSPDKVENE